VEGPEGSAPSRLSIGTVIGQNVKRDRLAFRPRFRFPHHCSQARGRHHHRHCLSRNTPFAYVISIIPFCYLAISRLFMLFRLSTSLSINSKPQ
jgi:hypothetical protein